MRKKLQDLDPADVVVGIIGLFVALAMISFLVLVIVTIWKLILFGW